MVDLKAFEKSTVLTLLIPKYLVENLELSLVKDFVEVVKASFEDTTFYHCRR